MSADRLVDRIRDGKAPLDRCARLTSGNAESHYSRTSSEVIERTARRARSVSALCSGCEWTGGGRAAARAASRCGPATLHRPVASWPVALTNESVNTTPPGEIRVADRPDRLRCSSRLAPRCTRRGPPNMDRPRYRCVWASPAAGPIEKAMRYLSDGSPSVTPGPRLPGFRLLRHGCRPRHCTSTHVRKPGSS